MALHDFSCPVCGWIAVDVNVPISEGAVAANPEHLVIVLKQAAVTAQQRTATLIGSIR